MKDLRYNEKDLKYIEKDLRYLEKDYRYLEGKNCDILRKIADLRYLKKHNRFEISWRKISCVIFTPKLLVTFHKKNIFI